MIQHSANTWASLNRTLLHKYRMELVDHMEGVLKRREHEKYGKGRGIVTVAGNADTLQRVKWSLQMLRSYGSELPVEIVSALFFSINKVFFSGRKQLTLPLVRPCSTIFRPKPHLPMTRSVPNSPSWVPASSKPKAKHGTRARTSHTTSKPSLSSSVHGKKSSTSIPTRSRPGTLYTCSMRRITRDWEYGPPRIIGRRRRIIPYGRLWG